MNVDGRGEAGYGQTSNAMEGNGCSGCYAGIGEDVCAEKGYQARVGRVNDMLEWRRVPTNRTGKLELQVTAIEWMASHSWVPVWILGVFIALSELRYALIFAGQRGSWSLVLVVSVRAISTDGKVPRYLLTATQPLHGSQVGGWCLSTLRWWRLGPGGPCTANAPTRWVVSHINERVSAAPQPPSLPVLPNINTIRAKPPGPTSLPLPHPKPVSPPIPARWVAGI